MQQIADWLSSGKNYIDGVSLFNDFGTSVFYKQLFKSGESPYNQKKLVEELQKICPNFSEKQVQKVAPKIVQAKEVSPKTTADFPKYLQIKDQIANYYLQANRAKSTLNISVNEHVLLKTALVLKKLKKGISDLFKLIDYFDENGYFPLPEELKPEKEISDYPKAIQLLRQSNSKAKRRLASDKCKNREATQALFNNNTILINSYLVKIGRK